MEKTTDYLHTLNEVQKNAVTQSDGPVLVVAGPGSGKTRVLTYRIAHHIHSGIRPDSILALTFTNKAAREMKSRIEEVVGPSAKRVWAGTFHSIFARILRVEAQLIGYTSNFTIYDSDDSKALIAAIIKEMNLNKEQYNPNSIRSRISSAKSSLITPVLYANNEELLLQDKQSSRPAFKDIYKSYVARCKRSDAMDFDDLLYRMFELLQANPENVLEKYRQKFQFLLVDEFQDTNHLQYAIVRKLCHYEGSPRNICVVGDDAQSIYGFRGATIQNILDFEKDFKPFGIKVFKLEQNYRSTEHIVQAANEVINFNTRQIQKKIWSDKGQGEKIKLVKALADTEEGKRVVDHLLEQKNRFHFKNADFAILYRTNAQSRIFEEYLRRYNIPYKVFGGQSFYQRKEIKDLLAYLRLAVNPNDDEALRRVINFPKRNIGNTTFNKIAETATSLNIPFFQAINQSGLAARAANTLLQFAALIEDFHAKTTTLNAYELGYFIAQRSGIIEEYKKDKTPEGEGRLENLNALLDGIKIFVEDDLVEENEEGILTDKSLASYLQNIALITDFDQEEGEFDRVTLMSVHSAKGLEFKSVFVVGLEEKLFPSFMSLEKMEDIDEERRLFYVAITRAEQLLTLSWAASRYKFGQMRYNEPSRFLEEIPEIHFENKPKSNTLFNEGSAPSSGSSVKGYFKKESNAIPQNLGIDPNNFKPSPASSIQPGMDILHLKFGKGTVLSIDGGAANRVATIRFEHLDQPEKRIMLKFAKLQIVEE